MDTLYERCAGVDTYRRFVALSQQIVALSAAICEARPLSPLAEDAPQTEPGAERDGM